MRSQRTVEIRAIGRLWMPECPVAWEKRYTVGDGPFQAEIAGLDDAEHRLMVDSGDLSAIEDYEIIYVVRRSYRKAGVVGVVQHTRTRVARPWKGGEDSEFKFQDLMYPAEEDES